MSRGSRIVLGSIVLAFGGAVLAKGAVPIEQFHIGEVLFGFFGIMLGFAIATGSG